jgi:phage-related baseplate assembly protein
MTAPEFISTDTDLIIQQMVELYESITGRSLQPAQVERLLINAYAMREGLLRQQIQQACEQMLLSFASAPALDYLAELVGVTRLPAQAAACTIEFTLVTGHNGVTIPGGTRVGTSDGKVVFSLQADIVVPSGTDVVTGEAFADNIGEVGNDYQLGEVNNILDPQSFLDAAANTSISSGGADAETDDELRDRTKLAPAQFSTAGPSEAYEFHAKSASSSIVDVAVVTPGGGIVNVYPLIEGGVVTPQAILDLVSATLNDERIRPLTDTVNVISPSIVSYDIEVELTLYTEADQATVEAAVLAALTAYKNQRQVQLGQDIKVNQIIALSAYDNELIFDVNVVQPAADVVVQATEIGVCGTVTVTTTGTSDG